MFSYFKKIKLIRMRGFTRRAYKRFLARKRMKRIQKIMIQERLHRQNDPKQRALKKGKQPIAKKIIKSHLSKESALSRKAVDKEQQREKFKDSKTKADALKRAKTIKERVMQSRERNMNLWAQGM